jgi:hypothetical protein
MTKVVITSDKRKFLDELAKQGAKVARGNDLPVSAMVACGAVESGFGTGFIFKHSGNPFSLQKWPHVPFPRASATPFWNETVVQTTPRKVLRAPFVRSTDFADAVRQWCEWILHWGEADGPPGNQDPKVKPAANAPAMASRQQVLTFRRDPLKFARNLHKVGFGESDAKEYADLLSQASLTDYD